MHKQKGNALAALVVVIILIFGAIGWVKNLLALSNCDFQAPYQCEVIHGIGIFPLVGAVTGYIDVGK